MMISMLIVVGFWIAIFVLPLYLLCGRVGEDRECPECGEVSLRMESRVLASLPGGLELRWCPRCSWEGVVRPHRAWSWSIVVEDPEVGTPEGGSREGDAW
jgi:hypothetical protein